MTNPYYSAADGAPTAQTRGSSASLRSEFAQIAAAFSQLEIAAYTVDSGVANALAVAINPGILTYADGLRLVVKISHTSTTIAATLSANGIATAPIVRNDGSPLAIGDLVGGVFGVFEYSAALASWVYMLSLSLPNLTAGGQVNFGGAINVMVPVPTLPNGAVPLSLLLSTAMNAALPAQSAATIGQVPYSNGTTAVWGALPGVPDYITQAQGII